MKKIFLSIVAVILFTALFLVYGLWPRTALADCTTTWYNGQPITCCCYDNGNCYCN